MHLNVDISIDRVGQQPPDEGDQVVVSVRIWLPDESGGRIAKELRFGRRLSIAGQYLDCDWGLPNEKHIDGRIGSRPYSFMGDTYAEAAAFARAWAKEQLEELAQAVVNREVIAATAGAGIRLLPRR